MSSTADRPAPSTAPRLLVSLATYNEAGNLRPLVESIREHAPAASILVIDDNSPDGTGKLADELQAALAGRPRDPPVGQARPRHGDARGDGVRHRERLRLLPEHGRRLQPPAPVHPRDPRRDERPRRDDRLAVRPRRRGRGGVQPQAEVHEHGHQRRTPGSSSASRPGTTAARSAATGSRSSPRSTSSKVRSRGLFVHGRDPLLVPRGRLPVRRDARSSSRTAAPACRRSTRTKPYMALKIIAQLGVDRALGRTRMKAV